jgi:hypothetical protein
MSDAKTEGDVAAKSDAEALSTKAKADLYVALGQSAQQRFNVHHSVEWKIHFGLWTFFVAGAALVTTQGWTPSWVACLLLSLLALVLAGVHVLWWLPHSHKYREECAAEMISDEVARLPRGLRPECWPLPSEHAESQQKEWDNRREEHVACKAGWVSKIPWVGTKLKKPVMHKSHWMSVVVTLLFASLFVLAFWGAWMRREGPAPAAHMTLEGGVLEIDGTTKLRLGE